MKQYAGLDVSLKEISICVVDVDGAVLVRGTVLTEPEAVASFLAKQQITPERIVHESGQLSIWLQRGLVKLSLPVIPTVIDQNPCAHLRMPRDMIFHGWSMRLFQAWQHSATMSS